MLRRARRNARSEVFAYAIAFVVETTAFGCGSDAPVSASTDDTSNCPEADACDMDATSTSGDGEATSSTSTSDGSEETASTDGGTETGDTECCGCLCAHEDWSCDPATCFEPGDRPLGDTPETGFLEIAPFAYAYEGAEFVSPRHRIFYSYQPAAPGRDGIVPLFVLFNGGPGSATGTLLAANTGPRTLDPNFDADGTSVPSSAPLTALGHVLYIDAPVTGFSYALRDPTRVSPSIGFDPDQDAATFLRVLLRFAQRHAALDDTPIILVGESYGGSRVSTMLDLARYPLALTALDGRYRDWELADELSAFYEARLGEAFPTVDALRTLFPGWVGIQAHVAGVAQFNAVAQARAQGLTPCAPEDDRYQCDEPEGYTFAQIYELADRLVKPDALDELTGTPASQIAWLGAEHRQGAYGKSMASPGELAVVDLGALEDLRGELGSGDAYYIASNPEVWDGRAGTRHAHDIVQGELFLDAARYSSGFLTDAYFDGSAWMPSIPAALESVYADAFSSLEHRTDTPTSARPGELEIEYLDTTRSLIRAPHYPDAGHILSLRSMPELREDLDVWLDDLFGDG